MPGPGISPSAALADRAEECRALTLTVALDRRGADPAWLTLAAIDEIRLLKVTRAALRADVVAQGAATGLDGGSQGLPDGDHQSIAAQQGNPTGGETGVNSGVEERLTCVNIAHADNYMAVHHNGLDGCAPATDMGMEPGRIEFGPQWFGGQARQQRMAQRIVRLPKYRAQTTRIGDPATHTLPHHHINMIVPAGRHGPGHHLQAAGHPQMQDDPARAAIDQKIFSAPLDGAHRAPRYAPGEIPRYRPAQPTIAHDHGFHALALHVRRKSSAGRFDLRQFRPGSPPIFLPPPAGRPGRLPLRPRKKSAIGFRLATHWSP